MKLFLLSLIPLFTFAQNIFISDPYLIINAGAEDPLYTTYTAAMERSRLYGDKGYKMDYYSDCSPLFYSGDQAGKIFNLWKVDQVVVKNIGEYFGKPVVKSSFPDMAVTEYQPFRGINVQETFFVHSSSVAVININLINTDDIPHKVEIYHVLELGNDSLFISGYDKKFNAYLTNHHESKYRLISSLYKNSPYPVETRDLFTVSAAPYSYGGYSGSMDDFYDIIKTDFYSDNRNDSLNTKNEGRVNFVSLHTKFELKPGESREIRVLRGWQDTSENEARIKDEIEKLKTENIQKYAEENIRLFSNISRIKFENKDERIIYLSAFNLVRGCMLPPADSARYNFYVFSREPLWGWGHGHQVLHESLSMIPYALLDPVSAQNSQRIYIDQQRDDGLIAYRHGPRGLQDYPHFSKVYNKEMSTTSAPFFSWINLEVYKQSGDKVFLDEAYRAGKKYAEWLIENRDSDRDGTFEWGPYGIIENVRDWYNAVFQVSADRYLDVDKEDISDELECLDLTLMMIKEFRSLAKIAGELGLNDERDMWNNKTASTIKLLNERMWDEESGFYYSVNKDDHSFKFMTRDLRRMEIIGFLTLWAEAAPRDRADRILEHLKDPDKFWRKYGIPTLAADDPWYSPYVDYCCKWNGPVWLLWNYMVIKGLDLYGYSREADEVSGKIILAVKTQLKKNHNFWESYSPDNEVLNCPANYIWDSIIASVLIDKYKRTR